MKWLVRTWPVALLAALVASLVAASSAEPEPAQKNLRVRTGTVEGWELAEDGALYVRLRTPLAVGEDAKEYAQVEGQDALIWYRSPPRQDQQNDFEEMFLSVILESRQKDSPLSVLTLVGEVDTQADGKTPESAFPVRAVRQP